jgi:hypothetical protein
MCTPMDGAPRRARASIGCASESDLDPRDHGVNDTAIARTLDKARCGALPSATSAVDNMFLESINGTVCNGCDEPIARRKHYYSVRLRNGSGSPLRLHAACYDAWARFTSSAVQ